MRQRKYKLTDDTIMVDGHILHRIEAVRDFSDVKSGDRGGYIESEDNLSHDGNGWVYDDARVMDKARVYGDASISEHAFVAGQSQVCGEAIWHLPHPSWWVAIASACINLEHDYALSMTSSDLLAEVDDYLDTETPSRWSAAESVNLLGALSMLTDEETHEVMCAVTAYWEHWYPSGEDIWHWAEEIIWWPSWARDYMPEIDEEDDDE